MCLITPHKEKKIAEEDMIVYKTLTPYARSILQGFLYELGKLYETEIKESGNWCSADFHASRSLSQFDPSWNNNFSSPQLKEIREKLMCIGQGFHSCKTIERAEILKNSNKRIFSCTIPKGSEYYEDLSDLLVSNKIIINEEV